MAPIPTPILRFVHIENLATLIQRGGLHAPNTTPDDGLAYRNTHSAVVQHARSDVRIPCGRRGTIHDYVPFYFGPLSPMLLNLKTGRVEDYTEGQAPLIYLVSTAQAISGAGLPFAFSDGHGLATFSGWYDNLSRLEEVDWDVVYERYWADTNEDPDRKRKKQAEFLVHDFCPWQLIQEIVVINNSVKQRVEQEMQRFPKSMRPPVRVDSSWYY